MTFWVKCFYMPADFSGIINITKKIQEANKGVRKLSNLANSPIFCSEGSLDWGRGIFSWLNFVSFFPQFY